MFWLDNCDPRNVGSAQITTFTRNCRSNPYRVPHPHYIQTKKCSWHFWRQLSCHNLWAFFPFRPRKWCIPCRVANSCSGANEHAGQTPHTQAHDLPVPWLTTATWLAYWCICWLYIPWVYWPWNDNSENNDGQIESYPSDVGKDNGQNSSNPSILCSWYIMYWACCKKEQRLSLWLIDTEDPTLNLVTQGGTTAPSIIKCLPLSLQAESLATISRKVVATA